MGNPRSAGGVGPGQYEQCFGDKASQPHWTMRPRMPIKHKMGCAPIGPLPAATSRLRTGHLSNSMPEWTFKGRLDKPLRADLVRSNSTPGPIYNFKLYDNGAYKRPASWSFGSGERF